MRPWASWTAKTAAFSLAAGLAATAGGLPGVALAASGGAASAAHGDSAAVAARSGGAALAARGGAIGSGQVAAQAGLAGDVCRDAGALLGIVGAACESVPLVGSPAAAPAQAGQSAAGTGRTAASQGASQRSSQGTSGQGTARGTGQGAAQGSGQGLAATVGQVIKRAVAPVTAVLGAGGSAPSLKTDPVLDPRTAVTGDPSLSTGADGASAPGTDRTPPNAPATARATRMFRPLPSWPDSGPCRASRTCPRPVRPARPPATGPRAAAFPCPGPRCRRPVRV